MRHPALKYGRMVSSSAGGHHGEERRLGYGQQLEDARPVGVERLVEQQPHVLVHHRPVGEGGARGQDELRRLVEHHGVLVEPGQPGGQIRRLRFGLGPGRGEHLPREVEPLGARGGLARPDLHAEGIQRGPGGRVLRNTLRGNVDPERRVPVRAAEGAQAFHQQRHVVQRVLVRGVEAEQESLFVCVVSECLDPAREAFGGSIPVARRVPPAGIEREDFAPELGGEVDGVADAGFVEVVTGAMPLVAGDE